MSAQRFPTFDEFGRPNGTRIVDEGPGRARTGGTTTTMPAFRGTLVKPESTRYQDRTTNTDAAQRYRERRRAEVVLCGAPMTDGTCARPVNHRITRWGGGHRSEQAIRNDRRRKGHA